MDSEKLIEEVRTFPALYDLSDAKYRNAEYKERLWKIISDTLKIPGGPEECKKRWASIRDQFRRTLRKRKTKSGQGATKKTKYKYEEVLEFLFPHMVERDTLSNVPSLEDNRDDTEVDPRMEEPVLDPEIEPETQNKVSQNTEIISQSILVPSVHPITSPVPASGSTKATTAKKAQFVKRKTSNLEKPAYESPSSQLMAYILAKKEVEKNKINPTNTPQHSVDIFLAGLAPTLKSLDPLLLNQAKTAIFATVQEFELKQMSKKNEGRQKMMAHQFRFDMPNNASFPTATGSNSTSHSVHSSSTNVSPIYNSPHMDCSTSFLDL